MDDHITTELSYYYCMYSIGWSIVHGYTPMLTVTYQFNIYTSIELCMDSVPCVWSYSELLSIHGH